MSLFNYPGAGRSRDYADEPGRELFSGFSEREWRLVLEHCNLLTFATGDEIIRAGERDDSVYIVVEGAVEVLVNGKIVDEIVAGSAFGEVAFFDLAPRTATIRGLRSGSALSFSRGNLDLLAINDSAVALAVVLELGRLLAQRYRPLRETA